MGLGLLHLEFDCFVSRVVGFVDLRIFKFVLFCQGLGFGV